MKYSYLLYRRGYLFSQADVQSPVATWTKRAVGQYFISFDPDNPWALSQESTAWVAFLGMVLDTLHWSMDIQAVADESLAQLNKSEELMLDYIDHLSGRFLVVYHHAGQTRIMTDAFGARSTCYTWAEPFMAASHPKIISDYLNLGESRQLAAVKADPKWLLESGHGYPGILTPHEGVYILTPNTLINVEARNIERFYPRRELPQADLADVIQDVSLILKRELELLDSRYSLLISLSAGLDTRTTLAAARDIAKEATFFTYDYAVHYTDSMLNRSDLAERIAGIRRYHEKILGTDLPIAREISAALGLRHICLLEKEDADDDDFSEFNELLSYNTYVAHVPRLAKAYLERLPTNALHIRSNLNEINRAVLRKEGWQLPLTAEKMAQLRVRMGGSQAAISAFRQFIEVTNFSHVLNYDPFDMFLWEHHYGTWLTNVLLESDVAFDTFMLFNCRSLVEKILSVRLEQRITSEVPYGIIGQLWPVLLEWPVNASSFVAQAKELEAERSNLRASVRSLQERLHNSTQALDRARQPSEEVKNQLLAVQDSFSYRLGNILVRALYHPGRNTALLPYELLKLVSAHFRRPK